MVRKHSTIRALGEKGVAACGRGDGKRGTGDRSRILAPPRGVSWIGLSVERTEPNARNAGPFAGWMDTRPTRTGLRLWKLELGST